MSVFLRIPEEEVLYRDPLFFIIRDRPVPCLTGAPAAHLLRRENRLLRPHVRRTAGSTSVTHAKHLIEREFRPDDYNIGMNCGPAAGQTVLHFHFHLIPRYAGDMADPRGSIRHCIADKGYY